MPSEQNRRGRPGASPGIFSSQQTNALELAYRKGVRNGVEACSARSADQMRQALAQGLEIEAMLSAGLSDNELTCWSEARFGMLLRLEESAGYIDGVTEELIALGVGQAVLRRFQ